MPRTIWLASYPKSGNTWFRLLLANLSANDKPVDINSDRPDEGPHASARGPFEDILLIDSGLLTHDEIDCLRPRVYEELARDDSGEAKTPVGLSTVRFRLVHDAYQATPRGEPLLAGRRGADGAILIVRDPRDVAPSLASHLRASIDAAIALMSTSRETNAKPGRLHKMFRQRHGSWSGHAQSWLEQTDIPVHLVRYEDMKQDPVRAFRCALDFAGHLASEGKVQRAVTFADFSELRRQEREKGFGESPRQPGGWFFRRGVAGAWRDELTAEQVARIEAAHAPMMRRLGYGPAGAVPLARTG